MKETILLGLLAGLPLMKANANNTTPASTTDSLKVAAQIKKVNAQYSLAFAKGDASLFLDCYDPNASSMLANMKAVASVKGQLAFYHAVYDQGIRGVNLRTLALYGLTENEVTEQGTYQSFDASHTPMGEGKYLVVWKRSADGWNMLREMFNADRQVSAE